MAPPATDRQTVNSAVSLYRDDGLSLLEVAAKLDVSPTTVRKYVKLAGVELRPRGATSATMQARYAQLRERRRSAHREHQARAEGLLTFNEAEDRYAIPRWCLRGWVAEGRLVIVPDVLGEEIRQLRADGLSMENIADQLGVQKGLVQRRLEGKRRCDLIRAADVEKLLGEPHVCEGCGKPLDPGRSWHPSCAGNRDPERGAAFAAAQAPRLRRLHALNAKMTRDEALVPIAQAAREIQRSSAFVYQHFVVERKRGNLRTVRLGVSVEAVRDAAPDRIIASGRLAGPLAASKGKKLGRKAEYGDDEAAIVLRMTEEGKSQRLIAKRVGISHKQVRGVLAARGG